MFDWLKYPAPALVRGSGAEIGNLQSKLAELRKPPHTFPNMVTGARLLLDAGLQDLANARENIAAVKPANVIQENVRLALFAAQDSFSWAKKAMELAQSEQDMRALTIVILDKLSRMLSELPGVIDQLVKIATAQGFALGVIAEDRDLLRELWEDFKKHVPDVPLPKPGAGLGVAVAAIGLGLAALFVLKR